MEQPKGPSMVVAANPMAVEAGLEILKKGGKAIDAAVAIQAMLGLVEPQSSGVGGGSFMMYYDAGSNKITFVAQDGAAFPRRSHFSPALDVRRSLPLSPSPGHPSPPRGAYLEG